MKINQELKISKLKANSIILGENALLSYWNPERSCIYSQFYIIRCFNDLESFIKIGSSSYKLSRRFNSKRLMPYNYDIIFQVTENREVDNGIFLALQLECFFQNLLKNYLYCPKIKFGGYLECYEEIALQDSKFIKNIKTLLRKTK